MVLVSHKYVTFCLTCMKKVDLHIETEMMAEKGAVRREREKESDRNDGIEEDIGK